MMGLADSPLHRAAAGMLRRAGYFVGLPKLAPAVGSRWVPTRGLAIGRTVLSIDLWRIRGPRVVYLSSVPGTLAQSCSLLTWHRWVTRSRARIFLEAAAAP